MEGHEVRHLTPVAPKPKTNAPAPRGRGRPRKDRTLADKEENLPIKHFKMWPFRYFGCVVVGRGRRRPTLMCIIAGSTRWPRTP